MFAFTGLNKDMVDALRKDYHIYLTADGRISISGLNTANIDYVADAFHKVTKDTKF
jgi:aspartate aminotransferase, mitochondrial